MWRQGGNSPHHCRLGAKGSFSTWVGDGAALSPDGMRIVTKEQYTGRTRLWDATNGRPLGPFCTVEGTPALSSDDGSVIVTTGRHGPRVWDLSTGVETGPFHPFDDAFEIVARSHDGKRILVRLATGPGPHESGIRSEGKSTGRYQLLDATSGRPVGEPFTLDEGTSGLALGPDGRILVVESLYQPVRSVQMAWSRLYDAVWGKPLGQQLPGSTMGFSPDGQIVLVGSVAWHVPVSPVPVSIVEGLLLQSSGPVRQVGVRARWADGRHIRRASRPASLGPGDRPRLVPVARSGGAIGTELESRRAARRRGGRRESPAPAS